MRTISQLLLNFLLNACWQLALIAAVASGCSWLLRHSVARQRHLLWVAALIMSLSLPWWAGSRFLSSGDFPPAQSQTASSLETLPTSPANVTNLVVEPVPVTPSQNIARPFLRVNEKLATMLVVLYLFLLLYRGVKLGRAWQRTRATKNSAHTVELNEQIRTIIDRCRTSIGVSHFEVRSSNQVAVPLTVGIRILLSFCLSSYCAKLTLMC